MDKKHQKMMRALLLSCLGVVVVSAASNSQMPLSASFLGGNLEKERQDRVSHAAAWVSEEDRMNLWHRKARDQLSSKIMQTCQEEQNSIDSWTQSMHQTVDLEKKIQVAEGHIQNDMGATKISVLNKIERLKKFMNNLNEHIDRVNRIFSAAHLIAMQDLVQNILSMRQLSLSLRSTASYEDPAFNPIKTFAIPQAEEEDDNAVASFLELKSQLHTELTTSEESLQKTQELLSEMLGIVQSLDRVRKIGVDEVDQRRAAIKEHGERIKRDIEAWKKMKQDFEGERNVLAKIRLTIETVLKTKRKNLNLSEHAAHRLFGTGQDAIESHANVVVRKFSLEFTLTSLQ